MQENQAGSYKECRATSLFVLHLLCGDNRSASLDLKNVVFLLEPL